MPIDATFIDPTFVELFSSVLICIYKWLIIQKHNYVLQLKLNTNDNEMVQ